MIRFWNNVDRSAGPDGCWIWTGRLTSGGYGDAKFNRRRTNAHRISFEIANGPIPEGLCVCHRCDNRRCTNPAHLFLGTKKDNTQDMIRKGRHVFQQNPERHPRGAKVRTAKLTEADVIEIRRLLRSKTVTQRVIAQRFKVHPQVIQRIASRNTWRHIPEDATTGGAS